MEKSNITGFWQDYKKLAEAENKKQFSFAPELPINSVASFEVALQQYADAHKKELILTRESMYPHFLLDGIEYEAWKEGGFHSDVVHCAALHPETLDMEFPPERKKWLLRMNHIILPAVLTFFIALVLVIMMNGKKAVPQAPGIALGAAVIVGGIGAWQHRPPKAPQKPAEADEAEEKAE